MRRLLTLGVETIITDCPITLADTIETFEFDRADELRERALADGLDVPLGDVSEEGEALVADSDVDIEVDVEWLEEPPDHD